MVTNYTENNFLVLIGTIVSEKRFSHEIYGESFYLFDLDVPRLSENSDIIPITISERLIANFDLSIGKKVVVEGQFRSYNSYENEKNKLVLTVFAKDIIEYKEEESSEEEEGSGSEEGRGEGSGGEGGGEGREVEGGRGGRGRGGVIGIVIVITIVVVGVGVGVGIWVKKKKKGRTRRGENNMEMNMRGSVTESTMSMSGGKGSVSSDFQVLVAD